jgi:predicted porin
MIAGRLMPAVVCALSVQTVTPANAQDGNAPPDLYGRLNLTPVLNMPANSGSFTELVSNASRIGFNGGLALPSYLEFLYQAEYQFNPANGNFDDRTFTQRNTYVGVRGGFGTLLIGRNDTPVKLLQGRIDLFNDLTGDIKALLVAENRPNDSVHYTSPVVSGFVFAYAAIVDGKDSLQNRFSDSTSVSLSYSQGSYLFGLGVDNDINNHDVMRLTTQYRKERLQLGLIYESSTSITNARGKQDGFIISGSYQIGSYLIKLQTGVSDQRREGGRQSSVGVEYIPNGNSRLFSFFTSSRADNRSINSDQFGVGYEYRF